MLSSLSRRAVGRFVERFAFDPATYTVTIEYSLTNKGAAAFQLGHWEVTRVPPGGLTFYPAGTGMAYYRAVKIAGLGILVVRKRAARMGRNPMTGEAIKIKAKRKVAFRAAKDLKMAI